MFGQTFHPFSYHWPSIQCIIVHMYIPALSNALRWDLGTRTYIPVTRVSQHSILCVYGHCASAS